MKDSGVKWIGEIPDNWEVKPYKYNFDIFSGATPSTNISEYYDGDIPWIQSEKVQNCNITECSRYITKLGYDNTSTKMIPKFTPVVAMTGATCGNVGYMLIEACANQSVMAFVKKNNLTNERYTFYSLCIIDKAIDYYSNGTAQKGFNVTTGKNLFCPFPPIEEQEKIANYLDEKCGKLDSIIERENNLIDKYKEYKSSLITETVTRGLNPNVTYKPTGIDYIGSIPEHWTIKPLKYCVTINGRIGFRGYTQSDIVDENNGAITLSPSNIIDLNMQYNNCKYISWKKYNESPEIMIYNNDIIFVKTGSSYGKSALVTNLPKEATINPQLIVFKKIKENNKYLLYFLNSSIFFYLIEKIVVGGTIPTISQEKIKNLSIIMPPITEQKEIADYLDNKCEKIDKIIKLKQEKIDKLKEYKKSLIYEYVTGKKKVN